MRKIIYLTGSFEILFNISSVFLTDCTFSVLRHAFEKRIKDCPNYLLLKLHFSHISVFLIIAKVDFKMRIFREFRSLVQYFKCILKTVTTIFVKIYGKILHKVNKCFFTSNVKVKLTANDVTIMYL